MNNFDKLVNKIIENNVAGGTGSVFSNGEVNIGAGGNSLNTGDTYAPGDMRVPKVLGAKKRKGKMKLPIQRRTFTYF
jgi:hypothetical protein